MDESIASFGNRHIGRRATRDLLGAMVLGVFGGDIHQLSLPSCFPAMAALEREHRSLVLGMIRLQRARKARGGPAGPGGTLTSFDGGLRTLVQALASRLGQSLQLGAAVDRLGVRDGGVRLHLSRGEELQADAAVLATPAPATAALLGPLDARLGELAASIPYASMAVVHLAWPRAKVAHALDGFGFLVPPHESRRILGSIFVSSIFPWRAPPDQALFTVMVGGATRPELAALPDAELERIAAEELASIVGADGPPTLAQVVKWPSAIPQYVVGHGRLVEEAESRASRLGPVFLGGNAWRGVGLNDCVVGAASLADTIASSLQRRSP